MSKSHDAKKDTKKKPAKTPKEKRLEKKVKKAKKNQEWIGRNNQKTVTNSSRETKQICITLDK